MWVRLEILAISASSDSYQSIESGPEAELRIRGSRFIGQAVCVETPVGVSTEIDRLRRRFHDATHHCWASRLGSPGQVVERVDDDGEPAGTAGTPILRQIQKMQLHDTLIVVVRYFGGTKLGRGGLARAYGDTAREALGVAPIRTLWVECRMLVECEWDDVGAIEGVLARLSGFVRGCDRDFGESPRFVVTALVSRAEELKNELLEVTGGRAVVRNS